MIDLHCHLLPGVDDGPGDLQGSLALAHALSCAGVTEVAATPHVRRDYPTTLDRIERGVADLREALARDAIELGVLSGAELDYEELERPPDELAAFGLGGRSRLLLVETPYAGWPLDFSQRLFRLQTAGFTIVLGHPERNPEVQRRPELLEPLVRSGVVVQLTTASLTGAFGRTARRTGRELLAGGLAHTVGSDAHGSEGRPLGRAPVEEAVGDEAFARWLVLDVPTALLEGRPPPPRPAGRRRRPGLLRRR